MLRQRADQRFLFWLCIVDLSLAAACWFGAYALRWGSGIFPVVELVPPVWWCLRTLPIVLVLAYVSFRLTGLYQLGRRWPLLLEAVKIGKAVLTLVLLWLAVLFFMRDPYESRLATVIFVCLLTFALVAARRFVGLALRLRRRKGDIGPKALIVGSGRWARYLARALRLNNWLGVTPMGFVDDPEHSRPSTPVVGAIDDLPKLVEDHDIAYVFVALPLERFGETRRVFDLLGNTLTEVRLVPDVPQLANATLRVTAVEGLPVLSMVATPHGFVGAALKRGMDVALSLFGIAVLSPLLAALAIGVKLTSKGPVLFSQERMGQNGRRFNMLKFRSMRTDAESKTGPVWATQNDDRRTKFGSFLRETSLDELPQLFNVLMGDMSLVGPRPERPFFVNKFRESIPHYMLRHGVKAGITGWAQVHGWRGNTSLRKRVQYDLYYIANWSVWMDLRILYLTVSRVLWDKNAY